MKARKGIRFSLTESGLIGGAGPRTGPGKFIGPNGIKIGSGRPVLRLMRSGGQFQAWGQNPKPGFRVGKLANPGVSVITCTNRPDSLENVLANYLRQNYPQKELIIVVNSEGINISEWHQKTAEHSDIKILQVDSNKTLGECLNHGVDHASYNYVAKCDDDDYYAPNYLSDSMPLFAATGAQIVGKLSMYVYFEGSQTLAIALPGNENIPVAGVAGATMIINKQVFTQVRFGVTSSGEDSAFLQECVQKGIPIFSGDRFNFVCIRHADPDRHTWQVDETEYLKYCQVVAYTTDYLSIITQ